MNKERLEWNFDIQSKAEKLDSCRIRPKGFEEFSYFQAIFFTKSVEFSFSEVPSTVLTKTDQFRLQQTILKSIFDLLAEI